MLNYSVQENTGVISGDDGNRYTFHGPDWRDETAPTQGVQVDFEVADDGDTAVEIYLLREPTEPVAKSRFVAGVTALLLGWLGVHKFYLGYSGQGAWLLVLAILGFALSWAFGIGLIVLLVLFFIGIVEGIIYLTKTEAQFQETYVKGRKPWF